MAIPDYQIIMLPLLKLAAGGAERHVREAKKLRADQQCRDVRHSCSKLGFVIAALIGVMAWAGCSSGSAPPRSASPTEKSAPDTAATIQKPSPQAPALDPLSRIDEVLASFPVGNMAFNVPESIEIGQTFTVRLILSPKKSITEIQSELDRSLQTKQSIESAQVRLSSQMEARMTGENFDIVAVTPETLAISGSEDTQWTWDVTAKQGGPQQLHLTVSAILYINGETTPRVVSEFDRKVTVNVGFGHRVASFMGGNWQWLWATLVVPAVGWWWKRSRGKKEAGHS